MSSLTRRILRFASKIPSRIAFTSSRSRGSGYHGSIREIVAAMRGGRKMASSDAALTAQGVLERGNELGAPEAAVVAAGAEPETVTQAKPR
jgi:hypothetical protein